MFLSCKSIAFSVVPHIFLFIQVHTSLLEHKTFNYLLKYFLIACTAIDLFNWYESIEMKGCVDIGNEVVGRYKITTLI